MPGFLTHYIAGKSALDGVSSEIRKKISPRERVYNLGTQGPDIFFYYIPGQVLKRSRGIAQEMHGRGLGLFLACMARLAKEAKPAERDIIFAYTAGFLMHYTVDCHAHPYVYAKTFDDSAQKITNSANHRKLETAIDVALLKLLSGEKPAGYSQWELIDARGDGLDISAKAMSRGIYEIYGRDVPSGVVRRAMKFTINATRFLQSKHGRRKRFMELAEDLTIRAPLFSCMVHDQNMPDCEDCLNINKAKWRAPWATVFETDSFMDRYKAAVDEGVLLIEAIHAFVYGSLSPVVLVEKLGNRSLKTGLQCA